ncbi:MAG: hypothetical protein H0W99_02470 [Acidobacteria bacterium]|nr:hypothetical protein [Acidobacteriota bacterium]
MLRRALYGIIALLMCVSLVFTLSASAHNIDLAKAQEIARDYARQVRKESNGKYLHYSTDCRNLFQGHNHYVRCAIEYTDDEKTGGTNPALCRESIDVFFQPAQYQRARQLLDKAPFGAMWKTQFSWNNVEAAGRVDLKP